MMTTLAGRIARKLGRRISGGWPRPSVVARSDELWTLLPRRPQVRRRATGFRFTEGPVWLAASSTLLFSDIPASRVYALTSRGDVSIFRHPSHQSNGMTLDDEGRLIVCEHETRRVTRTEHDGAVEILADSFKGKRLNSPNDVAVRSDGSIYFTDPPFGIQADQQELSFQGVYRISPAGDIEVVADDFDRPNGLAFSPDHGTLYVDDSARMHVRSFEVSADGRLSNGQIFADLSLPNSDGCPDGMKVDVKGHVFCTGPDGLWILDASGRHLGTVRLPELPANCAWGGDDLQTLFVTARTSVYSIETITRGLPVS